MSIIGQERELYEETWSVPSYATTSPGEQYVPVFLDIIAKHSLRRGGWKVLDAGTGSGKGALALDPYFVHVELFDVTDAGLVPEAKKFRFHQGALWSCSSVISGADVFSDIDFVYCTDVLEHIPEQFTMLCVAEMLKIAPTFISVCLVPDNFGIWVGRPLHQTVKDFIWWRDSLNEVGRVIEARDLIENAVYFVEPK